MMMAAANVSRTTASPLNRARDCGYSDTPALLNALTAVKTPCQSARPNGSS